jgi:hydrogenase maturation protease
MTAGSASGAPVLVLGLGNLLLTDDAVGLRLLQVLRETQLPTADIEFVDGGTQGLSLLPVLSGRRAVLILDAAGFGAQPGSVHILRDDEVWNVRAARRSRSAHEGNAVELLEAARLLGDTPEQIAVVGVEPDVIKTGIGLSPAVESAVPAAVAAAQQILQAF